MALFKHRMHDLPTTITIEVPEASPGPGILNVLGIIIGVVGAGFIIFGPETIYYNRYQGMNFIQMLQAYPGPIASVGFMLVVLASAWSASESQKRGKAIEDSIFSQLAFTLDDIPDDQQLNLELQDDGRFLVSLEQADALQNPDSAVNAEPVPEQEPEPVLAEVATDTERHSSR